MFRRKEDGTYEEDTSAEGASYLSGDSSASSPSTSDAVASPITSMIPPVAAPKPVPPAASGFRPQVSPSLAARGASPATTNSLPLAPAPVQVPSLASGGGIRPTKRILTVGTEIHMKGQISTCDRLIIEGSVDADLKDVHTLELAESGSFKGTAEIEEAEISGTYEGDLVVKGRLIIYATGRVNGNITYGEIEIERGGRITGTIMQSAHDASVSARPLKKAAA